MGGQFKCPHCGQPIYYDVHRHPLERIIDHSKPMRSFQATAWVRNDETGQFENQDGGGNNFPAPPAPGTYRESQERTPIHVASLSSQWATPTAKALTVWAGVSSLSFAAMAGYTNVPRPGLAAFLIGGTIGAAQWAKDQSFFRDALYAVKNFTEEFLQQDLDGDGSVGKPPNPGTVVIKGRESRPESEASKKRRAMVAFVELIYNKQHSGQNTGVKALYGIDLPGGYKVNYDFHKQIGQHLIDGGYAEIERVGANTTWKLLPDVTLPELIQAIRVWDNG